MNLTKQLHKNNTVTAEGLSDQYAPVSTEIVLAPFFNNGWTTKKHLRPARNKEGDRIGKELITLTHPDFLYPNGDHLTVECLNSNNGLGALVLMGGYGRVVCSNGLIIGDIEGGRFVHRGTTIYEKIQDQYEKIVAKLETMRQDITLLQDTTLDSETIRATVKNFVVKQFERDTKKYRTTVEVPERVVDRLLSVRRPEDSGHDAFTVLNVVQENVIRKGLLWGVKVTDFNKETKETTVDFKGKNATENKVTAVPMNKAISDAFLSVVKEVA